MRFSRSKKGISTAIAQIIMISATLAMGALIINWAIPSLGLYQSTAGHYFLDRSEYIKESFIIEDVWFNSTGANNTIDITIRNIGDIEINIVAIYLNGTDYLNGTQIVYVAERTDPIIINYDWQSDESFLIVVITERGNQISSKYISPT